jgi:4-hydroxy-tetrahydrodipicolinate synthase
METLSLQGTGVALVTPFLQDGTIDHSALARIIEHVITGNVDYLVALGTTGESVTLSETETEAVLYTILTTNAGRKPVLVGCGGYNTYEVIRKMDSYESKFIFDGYMSVTPYYNKPSQNGLFEHYRLIAQSTSKPILLYNVPPRTAVNLLPETVVKLSHHFPNIIGIKEASGGLDQGMEIISRVRSDFQVLAGDDVIALPGLSVGFRGCVSVLANAFPNPISSMMRFALNDFDRIAARQIHYSMMPLFRLAFKEGNPTGIKAMLNVIGLCGLTVRPPLAQATPGLIESIREAVGLNISEPFSN